MLSTGSTAPAFEVPGATAEETGTYELSAYTEEGAAVLLFYPFDFSPICTRELCEFRDSEWLTMTPEVDVFGISTDSAYAHKAYARENDLPFPLLSDNDGRVSERYGVLSEETEAHPCVSKRAVFVVDNSQTVCHAWEAEEWIEDPDIQAVHETITGLESADL